MNQSKQKSDALAKAVREYIGPARTDGGLYAIGSTEIAMLEAIAAYESQTSLEAIGPDEPTAITEGDALADSLQQWMDDPQERDPDAFNVWVALKAYQKARAQHAPTEPAKPATGEQPGADWMRDIAHEFDRWFGDEGVGNCFDEYLAIVIKHAPATPALVGVSARELIAWMEDSRARGVSWSLTVGEMKECLSAIEAERAAKAKEPK